MEYDLLLFYSYLKNNLIIYEYITHIYNIYNIVISYTTHTNR